jgi:hypothetical protein
MQFSLRSLFAVTTVAVVLAALIAGPSQIGAVIAYVGAIALAMFLIAKTAFRPTLLVFTLLAIWLLILAFAGLFGPYAR